MIATQPSDMRTQALGVLLLVMAQWSTAPAFCDEPFSHASVFKRKITNRKRVVRIKRSTGKEPSETNKSQAKQKYDIRLVSPHAVPEPHAPKKQAPVVLAALKKLIEAYEDGDLETYGSLIDDQCSIFDEKSGKMVMGKKKVLSYLSGKFDEIGKTGKTPLVTFKIDNAFVKVRGRTAVVTYNAIQEFGGEHPVKTKAMVTTVFVKDGDRWKKLHERGDWHLLPERTK